MLLDQRFGRLRFLRKIYNPKCNVTFSWSVALIHWEMVLVRTKLNRECVVYPPVWIIPLTPTCWISFMIPVALNLVLIPPMSKLVSIPPWLKLVFYRGRLKLVLRFISTDCYNDRITSLYSNVGHYRPCAHLNE